MLKPRGLLYIHDVILEEHNAVNNIVSFIEMLSEKGGQSLKEETARHFKEEFSTFDWVLDGLLSLSGFSIKSKNIERGVLGTYICFKN